MEKISQSLKDVMLKVSEACMMGDTLEVAELQAIYKTLKTAQDEINLKQNKDIIDIPKLPKGDRYNGFPRITYAIICELYSRDKFFNIADLCALTGSSRNQVKNDMERLEQDGFITHIDGYTAERKTRYYKYKPSKRG